MRKNFIIGCGQWGGECNGFQIETIVGGGDG